jgi:hypothetical protein
MEPVFLAILHVAERLMIDGAAGFRTAVEAMGALALVDWAAAHPGVCLGAGAVVGISLLSSLQSKKA